MTGNQFGSFLARISRKKGVVFLRFASPVFFEGDIVL